jgi:hypothetical protein
MTLHQRYTSRVMNADTPRVSPVRLTIFGEKRMESL